MTTRFQPPQRKPITRAAARNAALINQLATPGLGSVMAGRILEGIGQLVLAVAGFGLFVAWFVTVLTRFYALINGSSETGSAFWLAASGGLTFAAAWVWSLFTSVSILREAKANETKVIFGYTGVAEGKR